MQKKKVLFMFLGDRTEGVFDASRWDMWRSGIELCRHPAFTPDRVILVHSQNTAAMAHLLYSDLSIVRPSLEVRLLFMPLQDKHSVQEMFLRVLNLLEHYPLDYETEQYYARLGIGASYAAIMALSLLITSGHLHAELLSLEKPIAGEPECGTVRFFAPAIGDWLQLAAKAKQGQLHSVNYLKAGIKTRNASYNQLLEKIERVCLQADSPILITGSTGTGKSQLASRIFALKKKEGLISGEFVPLNCSTLYGDMALTTLFGHTKGSFTGALFSREGLLRKVHKGILFLDEIADLPPECQARVLTALETGWFYPVGSDKLVHSRFQLICCTNRDLHAEVTAGRFREDLLARIDLWRFRLPSLFERREDIEPNLRYELERLSAVHGRKVLFVPRAERLFLDFATSGEALWPGNFREFSGSLERMCVMSEKQIITSEVVEEEIRSLRALWRNVRPEAVRRSGGDVPQGQSRNAASIRSSTEPEKLSPSPCPPEAAPQFPLIRGILGSERAGRLDEFDKAQLECVLSACLREPTRSEAGKALFSVSRGRRKTVNDTDRLHKYLAKFGLSWETVAAFRYRQSHAQNIVEVLP
jgi:transcriptional regulatory protein RtcR